MKAKTLIALLLTVCMVMSFVGCKANNGKDNSDNKPSTPTGTTQILETSEPTEIETTELEIIETEPTETESRGRGNSDSGWVNLDEIEFSINGKWYTLGVATLQDLIDDGVEFDEDSMAALNNSVSKNSEERFAISLGEWLSASVYVMNDTDSPKPANECFISTVYLPVYDDETQDIISFRFPLDMTIDELKENAGEPTAYDRYDGDNDYYSETFEYQRESSRYFGDYGYEFEFTKGVLSYVTIDYMP